MKTLTGYFRQILLLITFLAFKKCKKNCHIFKTILTEIARCPIRSHLNTCLRNPQNKLKTNSDIVMTVITCNARFLSASLLSDWLPLLPDQHQTAPDYRYALLRLEKWQDQGQHLADDLWKWNEDKFYLHRGEESDFIIDRMLWNVKFRHMGLDGKKCSVWKLKLLYNNPNWFQ